jgi:hypothetical protein
MLALLLSKARPMSIIKAASAAASANSPVKRAQSPSFPAKTWEEDTNYNLPLWKSYPLPISPEGGKIKKFMSVALG